MRWLTRIQTRSVQRWIHLLSSVILGTYLYAPVSGIEAVEVAIRLVVFPGLVLSGLLMWKGPALRRWYRTHGTEPGSQ